MWMLLCVHMLLHCLHCGAHLAGLLVVLARYAHRAIPHDKAFDRGPAAATCVQVHFYTCEEAYWWVRYEDVVAVSRSEVPEDYRLPEVGHHAVSSGDNEHAGGEF